MPVVFVILDELARESSLEKMLYTDMKANEAFELTIEGKMAKVP